MCFVKDIGNECYRVAEADIECYKVVVHGFSNDKGVYTSPYMRFSYRLGEVYDTDVCEVDGGVQVMNRLEWLNGGVFHSYRTEADAYYLLHETSCRCHYSKNKNIQANVLKCVIPKGSIYWENKHEYASTAIKAVEVIK